MCSAVPRARESTRCAHTPAHSPSLVPHSRLALAALKSNPLAHVKLSREDSVAAAGLIADMSPEEIEEMKAMKAKKREAARAKKAAEKEEAAKAGGGAVASTASSGASSPSSVGSPSDSTKINLA